MGEMQIQNSKAEHFLERIFWRGNANAEHNPSVLAPPTRARTSPFAENGLISEAPFGPLFQQVIKVASYQIFFPENDLFFLIQIVSGYTNKLCR